MLLLRLANWALISSVSGPLVIEYGTTDGTDSHPDHSGLSVAANCLPG